MYKVHIHTYIHIPYIGGLSGTQRRCKVETKFQEQSKAIRFSWKCKTNMCTRDGLTTQWGRQGGGEE